jgi:hypothetical protein
VADQGKQIINQRAERRRQALQTPRAAAVAGILFAVLFIVSVGLMRLAIPEEVTATNDRRLAAKQRCRPSTSP